jgi:hypothetical protein
MITAIRRFALALVFSTASAAANEPAPDSAVAALGHEPVSRLEWGLDRLRRDLLEIFAVDPLTLEPSVPPYFINANFVADDALILIEVGRTLPAVAADEARRLCTEYITRVRGFLSVDKIGNPAVNGISDLAAEYFHPAFATAKPEPAFARALDGAVRLRALVAAPMSGVYAICTAKLTGSPIHHLE